MRKMALLAVAVAGLFVLMAPSAVFAATSPPFSGTWTTTYYTTSGGSCTTTQWTTPTFHDGSSGFATNNVGGPPIEPLVDYGSSICVVIGVTGATVSDGTIVYVEVANSGTIACFTIQGGSGSNAVASGTCGTKSGSTGPLLFTNNIQGSGTTVCTVPIFVNTVSPPNGKGGGQADHLVLGTSTGSSCAPTTAPEFPLGLALTLAIAFPLMLAMKNRKFFA